MRTIFVYLALLTSFFGFSQTPFPQQEIQYSPGGKFEKLYDHYGNEYRLKDLKIDTVTPTNKSISFPNECNSGYFKLYYEDGSGFEIQGNSVHQQRRAVLCQLFYDLSQFIIPANPNTPVNIWVKNINNIFPSTTNLPAGAATGLYSIPSNTNSTLGGIIENQIWKTINSGVDAYTNVGASFLNENQSFGNSSPTYYHGIITFDFTNINWNTNLSVSPSSIQHDLYSVALHEIIHALGFASLIGIDGSSKLGSPYYTRYDTHLKAFGTDPLITTNSTCSQSYNFGFNTVLSSSVLAPLTVNCNVNNSIFFVGQSVNQPVYLSSSFSNGSSLSHFEDLCHLSNIDNSNGSYPDNQYYVMSDVQGLGPVFMKRYLKVEEKNTLCEIGYNLNSSFGDITNANLNYIAYPSSNCSNSSVVGVNDGIGTNSEYTFVINPTESYTFNYNDFLNNDYPSQGNNLTFECAESVYGLGTIDLISPNSFEYTAISNTNGIDLIRYIPIGPNGDRGNITYIYVYVPDGTCVPSACNNYVSNGDFESSYGCANFSITEASSKCWSVFNATPDLFVTQFTPSNNCFWYYTYSQIPLNFTNPPTYTWNLDSQNNFFIGLIGTKNGTSEGIQNKLNLPLLVNENYILSFRAKSSNNPNHNNLSTIVFATSSLPSAITSLSIVDLPPMLDELTTIVVPLNNSWQYYQVQVSINSNISANYLTILNAGYLINSVQNNATSSVFLDDISIIKLSDQITFTPPTTLCLNQTVDLQSYTNTPGGNFSGSGVSGATFDPIIAGIGTHEITYTYINNINCITNVSAYITVVNDNLSVSINSSQTSFCEGGSASLTATGSNITSYLWSTNETTSIISVSPLSSNSYSVTVINSSGCQATASQSITVNPSNITPTFTQLPNYCVGQSPANLPNTSNNSIIGTWNPLVISTSTAGTSTYTFTPTAGQCASNATMNITVNPTITPTFTQLPNYCVGQSPANLPNTSNNSIIGTWNPQVISTSTSGTTTYTFTPTNGQCATTTTMTITVNPSITPTFTQVPPICSGGTLNPLPTTSTNGKTGTWSPALNNTATTTYTFTPTAGQCATTTTMTITVNPLPAVPSISVTETSGLSNNDGIICTGASVTLVTSGGTSYSWSNGQTTASITVSPTSSTTYTVSITNANGCQRSNSRTITVNPLPVFSINNSNPVICSGTAVTLSPNPSAGLSNFSWSPGGQTAASINVNPSTTTNYTLSARSTTTGCYNTASTTITVNSVSNTACCNPAGFTFNSPINTSAMGTIPNGSTVQVNADITVNQNRTFTNCTLRMGPNVKITVNSGITLTLTNCKVFSCSEMWDGIYVGQGAQVIVSNSRIEDATYAIYSTEEGNYKVTNSIFNKNNVAIQVENYTTHLGEVTGTTFDGTAVGSFDPSTATLKAPMIGQKAHFGIYIVGGGTITVGKPAALYNLFQNIETGIYASSVHGSLNIYRNKFKNIVQAPCFDPVCNELNIKGWPIWTTYSAVFMGNMLGLDYENQIDACSHGITLHYSRRFNLTKNIFTNILSTGLFDQNVINKCVFVVGSPYLGTSNTGNITYNTFNNFEYGVYYIGNAQQNFNVSYNEMKRFNTFNSTAIYLRENYTLNTTIQNNLINNLSTENGKYGIIASNIEITGGNLIIQSNTIKNIMIGIGVNKYNNLEIKNHKPSFTSTGTNQAGIFFPSNVPSISSSTPSSYSGITITNCNNAKINNNQIQKAGTLPTTAFTNLLYGIYVGSDCINSEIAQNKMRLLGTGMYLFGSNNNPLKLQCNSLDSNRVGIYVNSIIGNQGTSTAPQDNKWTIPSGSDWLGAKSVGTVPNFYTRSMSLPYMPDVITQMNPPTSIFPLNASPNPQFACITQCPPPCGMAGLIQVINEEGEYGYLSEEELKNLDVELYRSLKINPNYYELNTTEGEKIQDFVDSMAQTNTSKIYEFEEKIVQKDTIGAIDKITEFQPTSEIESFHKTTKEIYSHSWLINKSSLSVDDSLALYSIAYQSPRVSGNAVYQARAMLGLIILDTETYSAKSSSISIETIDNIKLYPNPVSDVLNYEFEIEYPEKGNVKIYSILGQTLKEFKVNHKLSAGTVDISSFSKGVYLFELNIEGNQKITKQFIVN